MTTGTNQHTQALGCPSLHLQSLSESIMAQGDLLSALVFLFLTLSSSYSSSLLPAQRPQAKSTGAVSSFAETGGKGASESRSQTVLLAALHVPQKGLRVGGFEFEISLGENWRRDEK